MFQLWLTSGSQTCLAVEWTHIPKLIELRYGSKILLKDCSLARGVLLLTEKSTVILGGEVAKEKQTEDRNNQTHHSHLNGTHEKNSNANQLSNFPKNDVMPLSKQTHINSTTDTIPIEGSKQFQKQKAQHFRKDPNFDQNINFQMEDVNFEEDINSESELDFNFGNEGEFDVAHEKDFSTLNTDFSIQNTDFSIQNRDFSIQNTDLGIQNRDLAIQNRDLGTDKKDFKISKTGKEELQIISKTEENNELDLFLDDDELYHNSKRTLYVISESSDNLEDSISVEELTPKEDTGHTSSAHEAPKIDCLGDKDNFREGDVITISGIILKIASKLKPLKFAYVLSVFIQDGSGQISATLPSQWIEGIVKISPMDYKALEDKKTPLKPLQTRISRGVTGIFTIRICPTEPHIVEAID